MAAPTRVHLAQSEMRLGHVEIRDHDYDLYLRWSNFEVRDGDEVLAAARSLKEVKDKALLATRRKAAKVQVQVRFLQLVRSNPNSPVMFQSAVATGIHSDMDRIVYKREGARRVEYADRRRHGGAFRTDMPENQRQEYSRVDREIRELSDRRSAIVEAWGFDLGQAVEAAIKAELHSEPES